MKNNLRILFLGIAAALGAHASQITFSSQGTDVDPNEWNTIGVTLAVFKDPGWAPALAGSSWVSFAQTANQYLPGYTSPASGTVVSFYEMLVLPWDATSATVTYRADDTSALYVNDVLVRAEAPSAGNTYRVCSDFAVGCTINTQLTVDITAYLREGANTIRFDVAQRGGYSYGLNYAGMAEGSGNHLSSTPEPATFLMIGAALVGLGLFRRKA